MIICLGKELPKGFSFVPSHISFKDILEALDIISKKIPKGYKIIAQSLTPIQEMNLGLYIPTIMEYCPQTATFLDPSEIFLSCVTGKSLLRPSADFVIFNEKDKVACVAYSKEAPVICFEGLSTGKKCIGTILRHCLTNEKIANFVFSNIIESFHELNIKVTVALATNYFYDDIKSNLKDYIFKLFKSYGAVVECDIKSTLDPQDPNNNLYCRYDETRNNNAVILF